MTTLIDDMQKLHNAMKMAVDSGMLPKYADEETYVRNWRTMQRIIESPPDPHLPAITPESWLAMLPDVVRGMDEAQRESLVSATLSAFDQAGVELAGCLLREFNAARWWR